ncbi:MAG TPA: nucleotide exchange factor GrpE [Thermoguttaceae bacterium]|nr:nucleotide exchange factor GrpE [Thermoguttaceae bacterium]
MSKKERKTTEPSKPATFDREAAEQMAADVAAAVDKEPEKERIEEKEAPQPVPVQALCEELEVARDRVLRSQAELENYRKRVAREMQDLHRYADLPLMRDLLPVLDNINRAIEAAEKTHDTASLLDGVKMVAQQFAGVFEKHDCTEIEALGQPFDPHRHEAISQQPSDDHPPGTVVLVTQTGFQLHDRVVRPSQVIVSKANEE